MAETTAELLKQGVDVTKTLSELEKLTLRKCEKVISKGLNTFLEVGRALVEIRDRRLYRETYKTFERYCKDVWDLSRGYADQQIGGYQTVSLLESKMTAIAVKKEDTVAEALGINSEPKEIILPINEAQCRSLRKLKNPDDQVKAWGFVLEELNQNPKAKLTAALINKAVKKVQGTVVKKKIQEIKKEVPKTNLLSNQFKNQHQVLLDIIVDAKDNGTCKQSVMVKWLQALVDLAKSDD